MELQHRLPELTRSGLTIVAVSYDPVETLAKFTAAHGITFPLLSDKGSVVIRQYGLLNDSYAIGDRAHGVPHPGTFVIDARRKVTARHFEDRYQERNTAASIVVRGGGAGSGPAMTARNAQIALNAFASDETVAPGSRITLAFEVTPGRRIHVYAPGASNYQIVGVEIDPQPVLTIHDLQYPPSETYHFKPLNETVPVYQKPFRLTRDVTIAATREAQQALRDMPTITLTGKLQYQACDDRICFAPASIPVKFELKVKPLER